MSISSRGMLEFCSSNEKTSWYLLVFCWPCLSLLLYSWKIAERQKVLTKHTTYHEQNYNIYQVVLNFYWWCNWSMIHIKNFIIHKNFFFIFFAEFLVDFLEVLVDFGRVSFNFCRVPDLILQSSSLNLSSSSYIFAEFLVECCGFIFFHIHLHPYPF